MNFAEIIYQAVLFTATYFLFNRIVTKLFFKNRQEMLIGWQQVIFLFFIGATVQYFVQRNVSDVVVDQQQVVSCGQSGQAVSAPENIIVASPLNLSVDFIPTKEFESVTTNVSTKLADYVFSSRGAILQSMTMHWQDHSKPIDMMSDDAQGFLIGLDQQTPLEYQLVSNALSQDQKTHIVTYKTLDSHPSITKTFFVHTDSYQIDVKVSVDGDREKSQHLRLFMPSSKFVEELKGLVNKSSGADTLVLSDIALDKTEMLQKFWLEPALFGFSSKFSATVCFAALPGSIARAYFKKSNENQYQVVLESKAFNDSMQTSWSFYYGPKTSKALAHVAPRLSCIVEYGMLTFLAKPLANFLDFLKEKAGNYGMAIILIALLIKLLMLPFTLRGEKGLRQQAEFEKKRQYLQQKFGHDKAALDQAMAELIQKHGLPIFAGCLPMLMNLPVFFALNKVLTNSMELYGSSFLWLPDLSAADPYYVLSLLTLIGMVFAPGVQSGPRQAFSRYGFALFVASITSYLASGLALFIVVNSLFGIAQNWAVKNIRWLSIRFA